MKLSVGRSVLLILLLVSLAQNASAQEAACATVPSYGHAQDIVTPPPAAPANPGGAARGGGGQQKGCDEKGVAHGREFCHIWASMTGSQTWGARVFGLWALAIEH